MTPSSEVADSEDVRACTPWQGCHRSIPIDSAYPPEIRGFEPARPTGCDHLKRLGASCAK